VYRTLLGAEPELPPPYAPDWAEAAGAEPLLDAARRHLCEMPSTEAGLGDVLAFRWRRERAAKHLAIIVAPDRMVHAIEGARVSDVSLSPWWRRHVAAAFSFPGVRD
jgi:NlpC/P60 family putative phage cell wall peptidase